MLIQVREILGEIRNEEVIAKGPSVKIRKRLEKLYGRGNWKKMKGSLKCDFRTVLLDALKFIGLKLMASAKRILK